MLMSPSRSRALGVLAGCLMLLVAGQALADTMTINTTLVSIQSGAWNRANAVVDVNRNGTVTSYPITNGALQLTLEKSGTWILTIWNTTLADQPRLTLSVAADGTVSCVDDKSRTVTMTANSDGSYYFDWWYSTNTAFMQPTAVDGGPLLGWVENVAGNPTTWSRTRGNTEYHRYFLFGPDTLRPTLWAHWVYPDGTSKDYVYPYPSRTIDADGNDWNIFDNRYLTGQSQQRLELVVIFAGSFLSGLPVGDHLLCYRIKDAQGRWSNLRVEKIVITN